MTTTDMPGTPRPAPTPPLRHLRRSRTERVGAGVAGGLGEYFGVDPVLFRVLFATSAFFGGTGILAYLLAWAAIPEQGTEHAPIDGWVGELRRRHVPPWLVAVVGGLVLWGVAFSWWAPGPIFPVLAVVVLLVVVLTRREWQAGREPEAPADEAPTTPVDLVKSGVQDDDGPEPTAAAAARPSWVREMRAWADEARQAKRARQRRALPVKLATLGVLVVTLAALGIADSVGGIPLQAYFWTSLSIVGTGLLIGMFARRTPWSMAGLLPWLVAGAIAFAGSSTQLGDGIGQRQWRPTDVPATQYHLAFGQGVLDLRDLPAQQTARTIHIRLGAGQLKILAPASLNLTVNANVHLGHLTVDPGPGGGERIDHGGVEFNRTITSPPGVTGAPVTVDAHVTNGELTILGGTR